MLELQNLQTRFATGLLDPGADMTALFHGDPRRVERCVALYRGNLTANWHKSLGAAYPVVRQLVGDDFFRATAREFGRSGIATMGDLNLFGKTFADYLTTFAPLSDYPYMPDVARLEWLLHRAHYAADGQSLDPQALTGIDAEAIELLVFELRTGHYLFHSSWNAVGIWLAHQPGSTGLPDEIDRPSRCVVSRHNWRTDLLPVTRGEFAALQLIDSGTALGEALESAIEVEPGFDPGKAFPRWVEAGILALCNPTEPNGGTGK